MAQSDARFGYTASLSRSDHDLSRPFGFTCAPGMLLPVHADVVSPGDSLYVSMIFLSCVLLLLLLLLWLM